ncbi:MAG: acyltransferase family protein [Lachnospiraceae bacterium]|nr:acyltransferase family protein [Lachnospiraceae bacterium]
MKKNRIDSIDIFRGIGIIIMVMGHVYFGVTFDHFIHAFHMPMFYFVSGMFFNDKQAEKTTVVSYVTRKVRTLIIPYVFFAILHYLIWVKWNRENDGVDLLLPLTYIFGVNTYELPIAGALWFLTSLFLTEIMYFMMVVFIKNRKVFLVLVIVMALFGNAELYIFETQLPFAIGAAFVGLGLYHIGHLLFSNREKAFVRWLFNRPLTVSVACGGIITVLIFKNGCINMRASDYAVVPLFWMNAIGSIIVGINISKWLDKKLPDPIKSIFTFIGKNSIVYVCLNQLVIHVVLVRMQRVCSYEYLCKILSMPLILFILGICCLVMNKTFLRKIIGR